MSGIEWPEKCMNGKSAALTGQTGSLQDDRTLDRLEEAITRVTAAADRQERARQRLEDALRSGPDLEAVAGNIDALCVRIRGILERGEG
ncbi:hypothetical protein [Gluconobacter morbifer]|uniref:Uncharacterized protein n=1 Tax=Gluconobacter morbifer G707 TaxID=1088869 RepID=G6XKN6_9PROT|nr:hypothetical protein [Gluconobacter morbifer]EHH67600.1 hypothetical protein GMO_20520 [Gluconobacter morbifer G707]